MGSGESPGQAPTQRVGGPGREEAAAPSALGPYRIVGRIGQGSFGVVYEGRHATSGQAAAIKTLSAPDPASLWDMRREVQTLARIRHPGIVRILDEGLGDATPWYAMELLDGPTLRRWVPSRESTPASGGDWWTLRLRDLPEGSAPARAVSPISERSGEQGGDLSSLHLVAKLCRTLAYLHGEGLVHRDLKPENVVVRDDDWPVVVDFGLVEQFAGKESRDSLSSWSVGGTAAYLAPEQWRGTRVDARADLYSLGCILYELLTGRPPFVGATVWKVLEAHAEEEPTPPSRLVPDLPVALDDLVLSLLAKRPRDRVGHADDVAAALVELGVETSGDHLPPVRPYLYRSDLVGREQEREKLRGILQRARSGDGGLVLMEGESGVGKTRLTLELAAEAEGLETLVLAGECRSEFEGGQPLAAFRRLLQAYGLLCRDPAAPEALTGNARVLEPYCPELRLVPGFEDLPALDPLPGEAARLRLERELARVLAQLAERRAVLLVLDDLQWADELSIDALAYFERNLADRRVLVIGCRRSDVDSPLLDELSGRSGTTRVHLARLGEDDVGRLASEMLAHEAPAPFVRFLSERSEGNPYFVAEYLRLAVQQEVLSRHERGWAMASGVSNLDTLPLPSNLGDLIDRKIGGLSAPQRDLLEQAAVLGRTVEGEVLLELAGETAQSTLDALSRLECLESVDASRYRFPHERLRLHAYESMAAPRRSELHRLAAESLTRRYAGDPDRQGEIGRHFAAAGEAERAMPLLLAAARHAKASHAPREAERLFRTYLELPSLDAMERIVATRELCDAALIPLELLGEARRELEAAWRAVQSLDDPVEEARCVSVLGLIAHAQDRADDAQRLIERSVELATATGDRTQMAVSHVNLGAIHHDAAAYEASEASYRTALSIASEVGDQSTVARALGNLGNTLADAGRVEEALELYDQALALERRSGDRWRQTIVLMNLATTHAELGEFREELFEESLRLAREIDHRRLEGTVMGNLGQALSTQGRNEVARGYLSGALEIAREVGARRLEVNWLIQLGRTHIDEDLEEAEMLTGQAAAMLRELADRPLLLQTLVQAATIQRAAGRDARDLIQQCRELADELALPSDGPLGRELAELEARASPGRLAPRKT